MRLFILLLLVLNIVCNPVQAQNCDAPNELQRFTLPPPVFGKLSLEESIYKRRTTRQFSDLPLSLEQIGQLMWAGQGVTAKDSGRRSAPSGGRAYPIDLYLVANNVSGIKTGIYQYIPDCHQLLLHQEGEFRMSMYKAASQQPWVRSASAIVIFAASPTKAAVKYGKETAMKSILLEAGHISQNIYLQATSLGLGVAAIGGFSPEAVERILNLNSDRKVVYLNLLGSPYLSNNL